MGANQDRCKAIMSKVFGPASARLVDRMTEEDCMAKCRAKVSAMLGEERAKTEFGG